MVEVQALFKRKAIELATKMQARFPTKLMFVLPAVERIDEDDLFDGYVEHVHDPYGERIRQRDESFFLTTSDLDDPMQMVQMLRGLWRDMQPADKDAVWKYMEMFSKLVKMDRSKSDR